MHVDILSKPTVGENPAGFTEMVDFFSSFFAYRRSLNTVFFIDMTILKNCSEEFVVCSVNLLGMYKDTFAVQSH
jgi:hypothetical protein